MDKEMIGTGRTYDEAVEDACLKLGVDSENVSYEVLERPRTAFFGLKHIPAKVKVTLKEEYIEKLEKTREKEEREARREKTRQEKQAVKQEKAPRQPREEHPSDDGQKREPRPQKKERRPEKSQQARQAQQGQKSQPQQKSQPKSQPKQPREEKPAPEIAPEVLAEKGRAAAEYVKELLTAFGYSEAEVVLGQKDGMITLQLEGKGLGTVVGRRGDNLDAMQYLASLVANKTGRGESGYCRVVLDVDGYRGKREASLQAYARKVAGQAVRTGRNITLEPMNPYERRIVHSAVQSVEWATSRSIGNEPNRRVVISSASGAKPQQGERGERGEGGRSGSRPPRGNGGRGGRGSHGRDRDRRESQKVVLPPSDEPPKIDDAGISLYGKIEL